MLIPISKKKKCFKFNTIYARTEQTGWGGPGGFQAAQEKRRHPPARQDHIFAFFTQNT